MGSVVPFNPNDPDSVASMMDAVPFVALISFREMIQNGCGHADDELTCPNPPYGIVIRFGPDGDIITATLCQRHYDEEADSLREGEKIR